VNELTPVWQLGYVLAPARDWGGFGGMEVRVEVPRGWRVQTEPALRPEGGALVGRWNGLPADAISISAQKPAPPAGPWYLLWGVLTLVGLVAIGWLGRWLGAALGRRGKSAWWALPVSVVLSFAWTIASGNGHGYVPELVRWQTGSFAGIARGYDSDGFPLALIPVMLVVGLVVVQACAVSARRRALRERA
jgi:hypothetical protein